MFALPKLLQPRRTPFFMHYGPSLIMFMAVCILVVLSYGLTQVYMGTNFVFPVNLTDAISVWGVSGEPGVSWL